MIQLNRFKWDLKTLNKYRSRKPLIQVYGTYIFYCHEIFFKFINKSKEIKTNDLINELDFSLIFNQIKSELNEIRFW